MVCPDRCRVYMEARDAELLAAAAAWRRIGARCPGIELRLHKGGVQCNVGQPIFWQDTESSSATRTHKTLNAQASLAVAVLKTDIKPVPMNPLFWVLGTGRPRSVETAFP